MYEAVKTIKKMKRAVEKAYLKNLEDGVDIKTIRKLDFSFLKDIARSGITLRDSKAMYNVLTKIIKTLYKEIEIVRIKNSFVADSELGYRQILLNLRFIEKYSEIRNKTGEITEIKKEYKYNGHIVELQLHHEKFHNIRNKGKGHANYAATRFMMDFIRIQSKKQSESNEEHNAQTPQQMIIQNLKELRDIQ